MEACDAQEGDLRGRISCSWRLWRSRQDCSASVHESFLLYVRGDRGALSILPCICCCGCVGGDGGALSILPLLPLLHGALSMLLCVLADLAATCLI